MQRNPGCLEEYREAEQLVSSSAGEG